MKRKRWKGKGKMKLLKNRERDEAKKGRRKEIYGTGK